MPPATAAWLYINFNLFNNHSRWLRALINERSDLNVNDPEAFFVVSSIVHAANEHLIWL